jgi:hypothetical protein
MSATSKHTDLFCGLRPVGRFIEEPRPQRQRLVCTDDIAARSPPGHEKRLLPGEMRRDLARRRETGFLLDFPFVDSGGVAFKAQSGVAK